MTAMGFAVETGTKDIEKEDGSLVTLPTYDAWVEAWTPKGTLKARADADKAPYVEWVDQGYLKAPPGDRIRYDHVADHVVYVHNRMTIAGIAYDKYNYSDFRDEVEARNIVIDHVAHPQGGKVRAKVDEAKVAAAKENKEPAPLGLWMPGSVIAFENAIMDGRIRLRKSPLLMTALMGAAFEHDAQNNRWFVKTKASVRIDPAVALAMAIGLAHDKPLVKKPKVYTMLIM